MAIFPNSTIARKDKLGRKFAQAVPEAVSKIEGCLEVYFQWSGALLGNILI